MGIRAWLRDLELEQYERAFLDQDIEADVLPELTDDDLIAVGVVSVGHRRKLLKAIAALQQPLPIGSGTPVPLAAFVPEAPTGAERRQLSVVACSLAGSTELSAGLDPEELRELVAAYRACIAEVMSGWEGHVTRWMGDTVLGCFGWPRAHEDDAERAVRAGLALVNAVSQLTTPAGEALAARVGIATGVVVVGDSMRTASAREDLVVGETPNLAARLRELAGPGAVVIAATTRRLVGGLFELTDLGPQCLKGFAEPLAVWRIEGESRVAGRFEARQTAGFTPLVGREEEIRLLLRLWEQARDGEGQVVLLSGEPGIGKSRLVREVRERLYEHPHIRLLYQCSSYHRTSPLHPVIEQLERAAGFERDDPPEARLDKLEALLASGTEKLDEAVPLIAAMLGVATGERYAPLELTPQRQKQLTLEALLDQLEGLAAGQPVLVVHEDAHWIDATTQELLGLAIDRVRRLPVLLVITFRPEFTPPWAGRGHTTTLTLNRLGRNQGTAMVARLTGSKSLPAEVLDQLLARADGVPLFVEELTKAVLESGLLADRGDHYELSGPLPPLAIPTTLHDSLMARLDRFAPVKEVAQLGAVIGREFSHELLVAVSPLSATDLGAALEQLVAAELVFHHGAPRAGIYRFKHSLVQDVAYAALLRPKRQMLHARIADVLESRFPQVVEHEPDLLARHCAEAGLVEKAVDYFAKAGRLAIARSAMPEAVAMLREGLDLVKDLPDKPARWRRELGLQSALGVALIAVKGYAAAETGEAYAHARALCARLDDVAELVRAAGGQFLFHLVRSEMRAARRTADDLLRVAADTGAPEARLKAHRFMGTCLCCQGRLAGALAHLETAAGLRDSEGQLLIDMPRSSDERVAVPGYGAIALCLLGRYQEARRQGEQALVEARCSRRPHRLAFALAVNGWLRLLLGEDTSGPIEELAEVSREQAFPFWSAEVVLFGAASAAREERRAETAALLEEGLQAHRATGTAFLLPWWIALLSPALETGCAEELLVEQLRQIEATDERWCEAEVHRARGEVARRCGAQAEAHLAEAIAIAHRQRARHWELRAAISLARIWAERDERQKAHGLLAPIYDWFKGGFDTADLEDAKTLLAQLA